eukprot:gene20941-28733_t
MVSGSAVSASSASSASSAFLLPVLGWAVFRCLHFFAAASFGAAPSSGASRTLSDHGSSGITSRDMNLVRAIAGGRSADAFAANEARIATATTAFAASEMPP